MEKVVSLVDTDVVIVKARKAMDDEQIKQQEDKLTEKIGRKVVIIPREFEIIEYGNQKKEAKNINDKELVVEAKIDIDTKEATNNLEHLKCVAECINKELSNTCKETSNIFSEIKKQREMQNKNRINKQYKLLTKEEYINLQMSIYKEKHEYEWDIVSKGNKYIACYWDNWDIYPRFYSLDKFYDKDILVSVSKYK
ncbi:hypothetical protein QJS64_19310 (plasmid) [Paraclostridium bifermentans]|uniref:Uncharacterized protein n=1 Tax=Paraclostridium bifermentans TaxID=1490 RepID=A0ABY8R9C3_PARBF|nr:hypothetical protein QJS64_19310 [Paraclostridium bifermentans]